MQKYHFFIKRYLLTSVFSNSKGSDKNGIKRQYIFWISDF